MEESKGLRVVVNPIKKDYLTMTIVGTSPMIQNTFSEKAKKMMLRKHLKLASEARGVRNPQKEFEDSLHRTSTGKVGFPAGGIKKAMVSSSRYTDPRKITHFNGAFFVEATDPKTNLVELKCSNPVMREDWVRTSGIGRQPDLRYRGELEKWQATFRVRYSSDTITPEQIVNLAQRAGFSVGLGEKRPEKTGETYGQFEVKGGGEIDERRRESKNSI